MSENKLVTQEGVKHDQDKDRWELMPYGALRQIVKVLTFGAKKYAPDNWKKISKERYFGACMRHLTAKEKIDAESGLSHLAHAACCILFMLWMEMQNDSDS